MGTIAELGLAVHSESAVQAADDLDRMVEAGVRAEQAVNHLGETTEQAKARILGLAKAALESSTYQETLNRAYEATAGSAAVAAREQLNQSAAMRQGTKSATDGVAAQEKVAASEKKTTAAIAEQRTQLEKLLAQIDPTTAALARLGDQQRQLEKFKAAGVLDPATFSEYKARLEQASSSIGAFDATLNRTGMTAKATTAAMRTVPAQITDIFTSLAAGQQPMMVLLQQGGQLKDSFGGIGAAAQAVGGYVGGLINPFTLAAAAAAALGYAYYSGTKETDEYREALILTGNAAGANVGAMADLAKQIGSTVGTTGAAAEVLAQLAGNSQIAGDSLGLVATAALQMRDTTGRAVQDTVAEFAEIGKDPVAAAKKLNDQYSFLTAGVYSQITSLKEQGSEQEAVRLLTETYARTIDTRTKEITQNLSYVERAWNAVWRESKRAGDAIFNAGRTDGLAQQLIKAETDLADLEKRASGNSIVAKSAALQTQREQLQGTVQALKDQLQTQRNIDQAEENYRKRQRDSMTAQEGLHASYLSGLDKETKKKNDLEELDRKRAAALKGDAVDAAKIEREYSVARKKIEDDYSKKGGAKSSAVDLTPFNDADNKLKSLTASFQNSIRVLDASQKAGLITQQQYAAQKAALIQKEKTDVEAAYQGEISALESVRDKSSTTGAQRIQLDQKIADSKSKMVDALKKLDADQEVLSAETQGRLKKESAAIEAYAESLQDSLKRTQDSLNLQLAGFGLGDRSRQQLQEMLKIRQEYEDKFDKLDRDHRLKRISDNEYKRETELLQGALDTRLGMQENYYREEDRLRSDWMNGASRAFNNYIEETRDIAGQTEGLFSDGLHGVEDALADAAVTGKLSFKDMADSIIADLARIVAKAYIITPILAALGVGGDSAGGGGGGIASAWSSITGGSGGGGGITSMISSAKTVIDVASSKFAESVVGGWAGGDGVIGGIQGAFENGASYVSDAISGAFTVGSATATVAAEATASTFSSAAAQGAANFGAQFTAEGASVSFDAAAQSAGSLAESLGGLSTALSIIGTAYSIYSSFQDYGLKGGLTTAGFAAAGAAIGSVVPIIGTAVGAAIGAVVGSFASGSLFGGPNYEQLVSSAEGIYAHGQFANGGWVDGWKENKTRLGSGTDNQLTSYVQQFTSTLGMLYDALGDGSSAMAQMTMRRRETSGDYSNYFTAVLDSGEMITGLKQYGLDVAENLTTYYDDMMGTFLAQAIVKSTSLPDYFKAQFQEFATDWDVTADTVIAAIESVFTRFNGVNAALGQINVANLTLNETGMIASDSILNMVASLAKLDTATATAQEKVDALNQLVNGYYSVFFTADEQFADLTKSLQGSFAGFGLDLPDSREAYRAMVEDIDVTTAAGQAMFATMMGLATAADSYYKTVADKAAQAKQDALAAAQTLADTLNNGVTGAMGAVQRAVAADKDAATKAYNDRTNALNSMVSTATENVSGLTSVGNDLSAALKALRGDSDDAVKMLRAQAEATLQSALATARSGGSLAGIAGLSEALDAVSNNNTDLYGSMEDFARDQGRTANVVAELNAINGKQLTTEEQLLASAKDQLKLAKDQFDEEMLRLDNQLAFAQSQLDALNGIDNSVISVTAALGGLSAAITAALAAKPAGSATANTSANNSILLDAIYQSVLGRDVDEAGAAYWGGLLQSGGMDYAGIVAQITKDAMANGELKVPGYAAGGDFGGGLRLVGENGPELEVTGPSRIYNANQTAAMLSGSGGNSAELVAEVRQLRTENRQAQFQIAKYGQQVAQLLQKFDAEGLPQERDYA